MSWKGGGKEEEGGKRGLFIIHLLSTICSDIACNQLLPTYNFPFSSKANSLSRLFCFFGVMSCIPSHLTSTLFPSTNQSHLLHRPQGVDGYPIFFLTQNTNPHPSRDNPPRGCTYAGRMAALYHHLLLNVNPRQVSAGWSPRELDVTPPSPHATYTHHQGLDTYTVVMRPPSTSNLSACHMH